MKKIKFLDILNSSSGLNSDDLLLPNAFNTAFSELSKKNKKICYGDWVYIDENDQVIDKFYVSEKKIFQKNDNSNNDIFIKPIDISDNTTANANSIMLINFTRLGFVREAKELSESLYGYLNIYKNYMMTAIRALDFFAFIYVTMDYFIIWKCFF